jgi:polyhydroxyalkanoate synthesis repressor PhaR
MIRLIKRYESRKLYDTEESRYVSLEEIAGWVRQGQEVKVVDNATGSDVTSQTLTQIILDEGRRGTSFLPSELLHDLVRMSSLRARLEQLEVSLTDLEHEPARAEPAPAGEPVLVGPENVISRPFGREETSE